MKLALGSGVRQAHWVALANPLDEVVEDGRGHSHVLDVERAQGEEGELGGLMESYTSRAPPKTPNAASRLVTPDTKVKAL